MHFNRAFLCFIINTYLKQDLLDRNLLIRTETNSKKNRTPCVLFRCANKKVEEASRSGSPHDQSSPTFFIDTLTEHEVGKKRPNLKKTKSI